MNFDREDIFIEKLEENGYIYQNRYSNRGFYKKDITIRMEKEIERISFLTEKVLSVRIELDYSNIYIDLYSDSIAENIKIFTLTFFNHLLYYNDNTDEFIFWTTNIIECFKTLVLINICLLQKHNKFVSNYNFEDVDISKSYNCFNIYGSQEVILFASNLASNLSDTYSLNIKNLHIKKQTDLLLYIKVYKNAVCRDYKSINIREILWKDYNFIKEYVSAIIGNNPWK